MYARSIVLCICWMIRFSLICQNFFGNFVLKICVWYSIKKLYKPWIKVNQLVTPCGFPLPSKRLSCDVCLAIKWKYYQNSELPECVVYTSSAQWYAYTHMSSFYLYLSGSVPLLAKEFLLSYCFISLFGFLYSTKPRDCLGKTLIWCICSEVGC